MGLRPGARCSFVVFCSGRLLLVVDAVLAGLELRERPPTVALLPVELLAVAEVRPGSSRTASRSQASPYVPSRTPLSQTAPTQGLQGLDFVKVRRAGSARGVPGTGSAVTRTVVEPVLSHA